MSSNRKTGGKPEDRAAMGRRREGVLFPVAPSFNGLPPDYIEILDKIKQRVQEGRLRVVLGANSAMVLLYWDIGRMILERQERAGWGAKVIDRLSKDLREAFPDMRGFSPRNLVYMRTFANAWPEEAIAQQLAAQLPWFHNCVLLDRLQDPAEREWYARLAIEQGWSRSVLSIQIDHRAHERHGKAEARWSMRRWMKLVRLADVGTTAPASPAGGVARAAGLADCASGPSARRLDLGRVVRRPDPAADALGFVTAEAT